MIIAYGYNRNPADLAALGAERVHVDIAPSRPERTALLTRGGLRAGDTLLLMYLRDLGGSPKADGRLKAQIEAMGVAIDIRTPDKPAKKIGRKRKYDPTPEQYRRHRALWLDPLGPPQEEKCKLISGDYGQKVTRGVLNTRFGWHGAEKPVPDEMKLDQ